MSSPAGGWKGNKVLHICFHSSFFIVRGKIKNWQIINNIFSVWCFRSSVRYSWILFLQQNRSYINHDNRIKWPYIFITNRILIQWININRAYFVLTSSYSVNVVHQYFIKLRRILLMQIVSIDCSCRAWTQLEPCCLI